MLEHAEPPRQAVVEAAPFARRRLRGKPHHEPIAYELLEDLHLAIGKGLALLEIDEDAEPAAITAALATYVDEARAGRESASDEAALALACLYGQTLARAYGWGWAHVRCTRRPGILVVSPEGRHVTGPRAVIDAALERGGDAICRHFERLGHAERLPTASPGSYAFVR